MNPYCNYLAYLRNQCYGLRKFNYVYVLKMSAFGRLRQGFAAATAATALFAAPACAQETAQPVQVASNDVTCAATEQPMAPPDVLELSRHCDAVIYFNENVSAFQIGATVRSLREDRGYNVVGVAGFPGSDQIVVLRDGALTSGGVFSESQLRQGAVGALIMREMGDRAPIRTASYNEASLNN